MPALCSTASRLVLILLCAGTSAPAFAGSFVVPPASGPQSVAGSDTGVVEAGATLDGGADAAITWNGAATGSGVTIINAGSIVSEGRAIDTASSVSGAFSLSNAGTIASDDDALRLKGAFADGQLTVDNSGILSSASGQALDLDKATAASAVVAVTNSGTISSAGSDAVRIGGGTLSIVNSGIITTTADGKRAIKMDTAANFETLQSLAITNLAGGLISGTDDGIKISSPDGSSAAPVIAIRNAGTIQSTVDGQAIDLGGIASKNAQITIVNEAGGLITAAADDGIQGANGMVVTNAGTISSSYADGTADTQNNSAIKIDGEDLAGGMSATIINEATGVISGAYHGIKASGAEDFLDVTNAGTIEGRNGSGVNSNGSGIVVNYGTITGTYDPAASFGDGDGVDFDNAGTIYNYGTISGLGSKGTKEGETNPSTSEGIAIGGGTIVNGSASVTTALISGANNGILADDSNSGDIYAALSVTNYGTIRGDDGFGIKVVNTAGLFSTTIVNYGIISGTTYAVAMGDGDDLFVYEAGSSVVGAVRGEGGTDTLRLGEVDGSFDLALLGESATYQGFERLTLAAGSSWIVSGGSAFTGTTTVDQATLLLADAQLAGSSVVVSGDLAGGALGYLRGTGTIGGLSVESGGVVAPGAVGAAGTLVVGGDVRFAAGSSYQVSASTLGTVDLIAATGTASVDAGSSLVLSAAPGSLTWGTRYTVLSADGGVSGSFGSLESTTSYLFLTPTMGADANDIYVALARNDVSLASYATTANQRAVARSLDRFGAGATPGASSLYDAVVGQASAPVVRTAFTQLAGDVHATVPGVLFNENTLVNDTLLGRLRQADSAGTGGAAAALGFGGPVSAYADAAPQAGPFNALSTPARPSGPVLNAWAQGYGQWLNASSGPMSADTHLGGALVGLDATFGASVVGAAVGYSSSSTSTGGASADADTVRLAVYGGTAFDAVKLRAGADIGWSSISTARYVALTGERPQADYDGTSANLFGEVAYAVTAGPVAFEPFAGFGWSYVDLDGFTETGAPVAGLTATGTSASTPYSTLGVRAAGLVSLGGSSLTPHASVGWRHAFGDVAPEATLVFLSTGTGFSAAGVPVATDSLVVGAGLDMTLAKGVTLGLAYDGAFGDGVTSNAGRGVLQVRF
ncbi:autotransporter domain-containing protein [Xanthobacter sp. ZOL 2024]